MPRRALARLISAPQEWDRRKLQILLIAAALVVAIIIAGCLWSITSMLHDQPAQADSKPETTRSAPEDQVANANLPQASIEDAQPGPLSTATAATITISPPDTLEPAQVQTGFPHTPAGAMAQLIAIDRRAIESLSVVTTQDVITAWADDGGPTAQTWSGVQAVAYLLSSAGLPADGSLDLAAQLRPAMGFVKGTVGEDFVVPCVDFVLTVTPTANPGGTQTGTSGGGVATRVAVADCQRMVWRQGRWLIGPGAEPAAAPSIWPGTQASVDAGYQWIEVAP